jgi:MFS family permease
VIGPIVSGFVGEKAGWRAVFWVQFGFGAYVLLLPLQHTPCTWGLLTIDGADYRATLVAWYFLIPETYPPILLKRKAARLQGEADASGTAEHFVSKYEVTRRAPIETLRRGLGKPFELLFRELIVWTLSGYLSLVYGM